LPLTSALAARRSATDARASEAYASVSCWSADRCVAGISVDTAFGDEVQHDRSELLRWDGRTWTIVDAPAVHQPSTWGTDIDGVSCTAAGRCVVTGEGHGPADASSDAPVHAWYAVGSGDSGSGWQTRTLDGDDRFGTVRCGTTDPCAAVLDGPGPRVTLVAIGPDGSLVEHAHAGMLDDTAACSATTCAVGGVDGETSARVGVLTSSSGSTAASAPGSAVVSLNGSACVGSTCFVVGGADRGDTKTIPYVETLRDGRWSAARPTSDGTSGRLWAIACVSATDCFATGQAGVGANGT
jgi:hypothetical protein